MLTITIPKMELFNEETEEFIWVEETTLHMEHCLKSVRIWEAKWHKPFLDNKEKTTDEILDYVRTMCFEDVDKITLRSMPKTTVNEIIAYIQNTMTATWFSNNSRVGASLRTGEVVTAEIIYYWMFSLNVPLELENWHLNQLLTLLKVISMKSGKEKKMGKKEAALQRAKLNAERRKKYNTKG